MRELDWVPSSVFNPGPDPKLLWAFEEWAGGLEVFPSVSLFLCLPIKKKYKFWEIHWKGSGGVKRSRLKRWSGIRFEKDFHCSGFLCCKARLSKCAKRSWCMKVGDKVLINSSSPIHWISVPCGGTRSVNNDWFSCLHTGKLSRGNWILADPFSYQLAHLQAEWEGLNLDPGSCLWVCDWTSTGILKFGLISHLSYSVIRPVFEF